jgi:hypothetical protein
MRMRASRHSASSSHLSQPLSSRKSSIDKPVIHVSITLTIRFLPLYLSRCLHHPSPRLASPRPVVLLASYPVTLAHNASAKSRHASQADIDLQIVPIVLLRPAHIDVRAAGLILICYCLEFLSVSQPTSLGRNHGTGHMADACCTFAACAWPLDYHLER